jgi:ribosomal protein S1
LTDEDRFQDMESLLQDESLDFRTLRRGDVVEGRIMALLRDGALVDFGSKSEGIIPPNEMHSLGA